MIAGTSSQSNVPVLELGQEVVELAGPVPVLDLAEVRLRTAQLGDEVERLAAVGQVGDRVAHELLVTMPGPHHRATVEHRFDLGDAAPEQRAVPPRWPLVRVPLRARDAVDAVGRDHDRVGGDDNARRRSWRRRTPPRGRARRRRPARAGDRGAGARSRPARRTRRAAPAGARRGGSTAAATGSRPRRRAPPARSPARAASSTRGSRARSDRRAQRLEQAQRVELAYRVREQVDADAERPHLAHALVHVDVGADLGEAERGDEPADAGSDDDDARCSARPRLRRPRGRRCARCRAAAPRSTPRAGRSSSASRGADGRRAGCGCGSSTPTGSTASPRRCGRRPRGSALRSPVDRTSIGSLVVGDEQVVRVDLQDAVGAERAASRRRRVRWCRAGRRAPRRCHPSNVTSGAPRAGSHPRSTIGSTTTSMTSSCRSSTGGTVASRRDATLLRGRRRGAVALPPHEIVTRGKGWTHRAQRRVRFEAGRCSRSPS